MKLYCILELGLVFACAGYVGGFEDDLAGSLEPLVRYHPCNDKILTLNRYPVKEQFQVGSLTGAVAS